MKRWTRWKTLRHTDIKQEDRNTCYFLAAASDTLEYREHRRKDVMQFRYVDPAGRDIQLRQRFTQSDSLTRVAENSYAKYRGRYYGDTYEDTLNYGRAHEAKRDITGIEYGERWVGGADDLLSHASPGEVLNSWSWTDRSVGAHSYQVTNVTDDGIYVFNPWGLDHPYYSWGTQDGHQFWDAEFLGNMARTLNITLVEPVSDWSFL